MELVQLLQNLGLNEKEAKVYMALLQTGKATAYTVAKKSGLKKPTTYVVLENLVGRGAAIRAPRKRSRQYLPIDPEEFVANLKSKIQTAEKEALPELKALARGRDYKVKVSYYEGAESLKEMYRKMLKEIEPGGKTVGFYSHTRDIPKEVINFFDEYNDLRVKKRIKGVGIVPDDKSNKKWTQNQKKWLLDLETISTKEYDSTVAFDVFKNFTQIASYRHLQGIVIEDPEIARALKQILKLLTKLLEEREKRQQDEKKKSKK